MVSQGRIIFEFGYLGEYEVIFKQSSGSVSGGGEGVCQWIKKVNILTQFLISSSQSLQKVAPSA
jgi:hypothetical protein